MKSILNVILIFSIVFLGVIFLSVIVTSLFIGSGYVIALLFEFPLFNATALCVGVTFVFSFMVFVGVHTAYKGKVKIHSNMENDDCDCPVCTFRREKIGNKKVRQYKSRKFMKTTN